MLITNKKVNYLVVDTTAFIENVPLQNIAQTAVTIEEVVNEITNTRQLRRLVVLPYDLVIKDVFPENIRFVTEFAKQTGDFLNLSATDIKVIALTYQLEKEEVGIDHLRREPIVSRTIKQTTKQQEENNSNITGFFMPKQEKSNLAKTSNECQGDNKYETELLGNLELLKLQDNSGMISKVENNLDDLMMAEESDSKDGNDSDSGWITPSNIFQIKKNFNLDYLEKKDVKVACMTTDFAMQNVLKQMNLNVSALDGRIIKELRTYILRCYACFKTTSIMTKQFCPNCGNNTLKHVSVSVDSAGKQKIHINARHPLTARGKKFSLPTVTGGKHSKNPILSADQPFPDQRPTRLARTKTNPLDDDYIAGYSPFVMRDVNSKSAQLGIRPFKEIKHWMKKNPNEAYRRKK